MMATVTPARGPGESQRDDGSTEIDLGVVIGEDGLARPAWAAKDSLMRAYHDVEWGMPVHDEQGLYDEQA